MNNDLHEKDAPRLVGGQMYSMMDILGPVITCDDCGRWQRISAVTLETAASKAAESGWLFANDRHRCPKCARS